MGINSLLKHLGPISETITLKKLAGKTLAVDGYSWLHKSIFTCPEELCTNKPATAYITYFQQRYEKLKKHNIHLYMVFDGYPLGAKMNTNIGRREERENNKVLADQYRLKGDITKAREHYSRACPVTAHMAKSWINFCIKNKIPYIVAPFEADSQMVYLEKIGLVDGIISEDSDLLIFGCENLVTKLDITMGTCVLIQRKQFPLLDNDLDKKGNPKFPLGQLSQTDLYNLVCLSGCDYTPGIRLIGLLKAIKLLKEYNFNLDFAIRAIQTTYKQKLMKDKNAANPIPENYLNDVVRAKICFAYMFVFDPIKEKITTLNPLPENPFSISEKFFEYMGPLITKNGERAIISHMDDIDHGIHKLISLGEIHQFTLQKLLDRESQLTIDYRNQIAELKLKASNNLNNTSIEKAERILTTGDILEDYNKKNLEFILPLRRSQTVDNYVNKKLEKMVENRKFLNTNVSENKKNILTETKNVEKNSKFFKRKRSFTKVEMIGSSLPVTQQEVEKIQNENGNSNSNSNSNNPFFIESIDDDNNINEISINNPNHLFIDFSDENSVKKDSLKSTSEKLVSGSQKSAISSSSSSDTGSIINTTINNKSHILETINKYSYNDEEIIEKSEILDMEIKKSTLKSKQMKKEHIIERAECQIIESPEKIIIEDDEIAITVPSSPVNRQNNHVFFDIEPNSIPPSSGSNTSIKRDFSSIIEPIEYIKSENDVNIEKIDRLDKNIVPMLKQYEYKENDENFDSDIKIISSRVVKPLRKGNRTLARSVSKNIVDEITSKKEPKSLVFPKNSFFIRSKKK